MVDWICNWYGSQLVANSVDYVDSAEFQATELAEYTVDGTSYGQFKTVGNVSNLVFFSAATLYSPFEEYLQAQGLCDMWLTCNSSTS